MEHDLKRDRKDIYEPGKQKFTLVDRGLQNTWKSRGANSQYDQRKYDPR